MQYCSLQHWTLLSPPDISTTEHWFCFHPGTSFFMELLPIALYPSPVAYWSPSNLGAHLLVSYLFAFHTVHGVIQARILVEWVAIFFSIGPRLVRTLYSDPSVLGSPAQTAWFIASLIYTRLSAMTKLWELVHKEGWVLKNCCFQTVVLGKTLESPLDINKIKPVNPKGNQT